MSRSNLPDRATLDDLKQLAKERLTRLRRRRPGAKLAAAQLAVARDHGFTSWRALKADVERRAGDAIARFFEACGRGDTEALRPLLAGDASLARAEDPAARHRGWTGLHTAAQHGHAGAVRLLLEHGADPDAREEGDRTTALHWAAARGHVDVVRALLDAGADVQGQGDVHELDAIGWAALYGGPEVVSLLVARGARHHVFSALCAGDAELIRRVVEEDPRALARRMSPFEEGQSPLHFALKRKRDDLVEVLIQLGADLEAVDQHGRTALEAAMLQGDREAMARLYAAGAKPPAGIVASKARPRLTRLAGATTEIVPGINVPDIAATLAWYASIGFKEVGRVASDGLVNWGMVSFGKAQLMFGLGELPRQRQVSLWFHTGQVDALYRVLKARQLAAAHAALTGSPTEDGGITFEEDLYDPFYGGRQFSIRDLNGYPLVFYKPGPAKA